MRVKQNDHVTGLSINKKNMTMSKTLQQICISNIKDCRELLVKVKYLSTVHGVH